MTTDSALPWDYVVAGLPGFPWDGVVVAPSVPTFHGRLVEVLAPTPEGAYVMPDGVVRQPIPGRFYICRLIGRPLWRRMGDDATRHTYYGLIGPAAIVPLAEAVGRVEIRTA